MQESLGFLEYSRIHDEARELSNPVWEQLKQKPKEVQQAFFYELGVQLLNPDKNTYQPEWKQLLAVGYLAPVERKIPSDDEPNVLR